VKAGNSIAIEPGLLRSYSPLHAKRNLMTENIETGTAVFKADVANLTADPVLTKYAAEIRRLGKRVKEDVIEIGRILDRAQEHAGRGAWHLWVNAEFGWSDQTAYRFIHLYQAHLRSEFHKLWNSDLPLSGLYQLAAPKTPGTARNEIAERLEAGDDVSFAAVTEAIARHKAADSAEKSDDDQMAVRAKRIRSLLEKQKTLERELDAVIDYATEQELIAAIEGSCVECPEQNNRASEIKNLTLEEYFAQATGADIYDRIAQCDDMVADFLQAIPLKRVIEVLGAKLRAELPANPILKLREMDTVTAASTIYEAFGANRFDARRVTCTRPKARNPTGVTSRSIRR
jgi:hypothetical protein